MDGMLTLKEVMEYLELEQPEVEKLVKRGNLNAYKIGGSYLRFRKDQIVDLKTELRRKSFRLSPLLVKARDTWHFNRIYVLSLILLLLVIYVLVR